MKFHLNSSIVILTFFLFILLGLNQFLIASVSTSLGGSSMTSIAGDFFHIKSASAKVIIMPILNPDGRTTSLKSMPTITDVAAEPKGRDIAQDAMHVMVGTGSPFYAPSGVSFDNPVGAEKAWGSYQSLQLTASQEQRFTALTHILTCNYCCGTPMRVTINASGSCAHAQAARGFFRYMLKKYGDTYSNKQLLGEAFRWQAIWFPQGVVQDYLLATGRGNVLGHQTHGGAGIDGKHGITL